MASYVIGYVRLSGYCYPVAWLLQWKVGLLCQWKQAEAKPTLSVPLWSCITFAKYCATAKEKPSSEHESCLEKHYVATFPNFFSQYLLVLAHGLCWYSLILPLLPVYFPKIIKFYESWFWYFCLESCVLCNSASAVSFSLDARSTGEHWLMWQVVLWIISQHCLMGISNFSQKLWLFVTSLT